MLPVTEHGTDVFLPPLSERHCLSIVCRVLVTNPTFRPLIHNLWLIICVRGGVISSCSGICMQQPTDAYCFQTVYYGRILDASKWHVQTCITLRRLLASAGSCRTARLMLALTGFCNWAESSISSLIAIQSALWLGRQ